MSTFKIFGDKYVDTLLSTLDIDGDGQVSLGEFFMNVTAKQMDMDFRLHDLNDDGYISATEFMEVYKPLDMILKMLYGHYLNTIDAFDTDENEIDS